jgi:hypothetical protein
MIKGLPSLCREARFSRVVGGQNCAMNMTTSEKLRTSLPASAVPGSWMGMGRRLVAGLVGAVVAWGTRPVEDVDSYSGPELEVLDPLAFDLLTVDVLTDDLLPDGSGPDGSGPDGTGPDGAGPDGPVTAELVPAHGRR